MPSPPLGLYNPETMGSANYGVRNLAVDMNKENVDKNRVSPTTVIKNINPNKKLKEISNIPNPDLSKVSMDRKTMNLGEMVDKPPKWRINPASGVDYFFYGSEHTKNLNTKGFDQVNTPAHIPISKEQHKKYMETYDPAALEKEHGGVFFGGIKSRKRRSRRKTRVSKKRTKKSKHRKNKRKTTRRHRK